MKRSSTFSQTEFTFNPEIIRQKPDGPGLTAGGGDVRGHGQQDHQWQQFDVHDGGAAGALALSLRGSGTIQGQD